MRTEDLVEALAARGGVVHRSPAWHRFAIAAAAGVVGTVVLMLAFLGVRRDLASTAADATFWMKIAYAAVTAAAALAATLRLAHPGMRLGWLSEALAAPVAVVWVLAALALIEAQPESPAALVLGRTWKTCPWNIALLSAPVFIALAWALKGYAPTRLRLAGAVAGIASGALATVVYSLHCPESSPAFVGVWYVLGMAVPALVGAAVGPRVLHW